MQFEQLGREPTILSRGGCAGHDFQFDRRLPRIRQFQQLASRCQQLTATLRGGRSQPNEQQPLLRVVQQCFEFTDRCIEVCRLPLSQLVQQQSGQQLLGLGRRSQREGSTQIDKPSFATPQMQIQPAAFLQCPCIVGVLLQGGSDGLLMLAQFRKGRDVRRRLRNQSSICRDQIAEQLLAGNRRASQHAPRSSLDADDLARDHRQMQHTLRQDSVSDQRPNRHPAQPSRLAVRQPHSADFVGHDNQRSGLPGDPRQKHPLATRLLPQQPTVARVETQQLPSIRWSDEHSIACGDEHALSPRSLERGSRRMNIKPLHGRTADRLAIDVLPAQFASHGINGDDRTRAGRTDDALADNRRTQGRIARLTGPDRIARNKRLRPQQLAIVRIEHHQSQINSILRQREELPAPRQRRAEEIRPRSRQFVIAARTTQFPAEASCRRFDGDQFVELASNVQSAPRHL